MSYEKSRDVINKQVEILRVVDMNTCFLKNGWNFVDGEFYQAGKKNPALAEKNNELYQILNELSSEHTMNHNRNLIMELNNSSLAEIRGLSLELMSALDEMGIGDKYISSREELRNYIARNFVEVLDDDIIAHMGQYEKMLEAVVKYSNLGQEALEALGDLPRLINTMLIISGILLVAASSGVGWIVDLATAAAFFLLIYGLGVSAEEIGAGLLSLFHFFTGVLNAKTVSDLRKAGAYFGDAIVKIGIGTFFLLLSFIGGKKLIASKNPTVLQRTSRTSYKVYDENPDIIKQLETADEYIANRKFTVKNYTYDEVINILTDKTLTPMNPKDIEAAIIQNSPAPKILVKISVNKYPGLSNKKYAFLCSPEELTGLKNIEIVNRLGFDEQSMIKLKQAAATGDLDLHATLIELPKGVSVKTPTWNTVKGDVVKLIQNDLYFKNTMKGLGIVSEDGVINMKLVDDYFSVIEKTPPGQKYVDALPENIKQFRLKLIDQFGTNPLFSGKGMTISENREFGFREFILEEPTGGWNFEDMRKSGYIINEILIKD